MTKKAGQMRFRKWIVALLWVMLSLCGAAAIAAPAGYSKYVIPGKEADLLSVMEVLGVGSQGTTTHVVIGVTTWTGNTTLCYDHWEDGYEYDPLNPGAAVCDETVVLAGALTSHTFESANVDPNATPPTDCNTVGTCKYDGRDLLYAIGGEVTVNRASWTEATGTVLALAWEVYPVTPQLTTYILPFGEDLANNQGLQDFNRVFTLIQATDDNTTFDVFDKAGNTLLSNISLPNQGDAYLLDSTKIAGTLDTGTKIVANKTIQVHYVIGEADSQYEIRGLSAFPRGFWSKRYYAPVPGFGTASTEIYLFNPHSSALTVSYESANATGSVSIPALSTIALSQTAGGVTLSGSAVYLSAPQEFWGISTIDPESPVNDWAYSLVPAEQLTSEHYLAWAPGAYNPGGLTAADYDDSGIFVTPAQDHIRLFVDYQADGVVDATYDLDRLQVQYLYDPNDGDMSNARIWATGPYVAAYGQNPDFAPAGAPAIDVGYTILPSLENDLVVGAEKAANPSVVSTAAGAVTTFTLTVESRQYEVDSVSVEDVLPTGWSYVTGSTTITLADLSTITTDPSVTGSVLSWPSTVLGSMQPNQKIVIEFQAQTTQAFNTGDVSENSFTATGSRTIQGVTQNFVAKGFAFVGYADLQLQKSSSGVDPLNPGDTYTYTVTVTNPSTATADYTGISIYDSLPAGVSYVANSGQISGVQKDYVLDRFSAQSYGNNDGSINWGSNWSETNTGDNDPTAGIIQINTSGQLQIGNGAAANTSISRSVDLSAYTSAVLSYDYSEVQTNNGFDRVEVRILDGLGNSTQVQMHDTNGSGSISFTIPAAYLTTGFSVQLRVDELIDSTEYRYFDNFKISTNGQSNRTAASNDPPGMVSSLDEWVVPPGQTLTLTFDVTVNDPLDTGIDSLTNVASVTANESLVPLSASVTNTVNNPSSQSAIVGDRIWLDTDGDGVEDVGEPGLSNVTLTLRDQFGAPVATAVSDINGYYSFSGIQAGTGYYVEVTSGLPAGLVQSAPTGRTDNRTNSFDLVAGQTYDAADLGYTTVAGSASLGDRVWSDANGNGIQDAGEPGLAGVQVSLWLDDGDGVFNSANDTQVTTTTSAADGSYLFTGVTANGTQDYWVRVDAANPPAGYSLTTYSVFLYPNVNAGDVIVTADFGYQNTTSTYSITDRIWFDSDASGGVNGGEGGIAGVTVDLLDASLNVIATVTTDANGYFSFNGVANGNYTVRVTDTAGILVDYYGTTSAATNGEYVITNLSANLDNSATPSFGYNLTRTIGDTVFNDINGNGVQDAGELGISGVLVELRDGSCTPLPDPAANCLTVTTDSNGSYLFSGLADGSYTVAIDGTQTALNGFNLTTTDDDGGADPADTRNVTITGGISQLGIDYGYQANTATIVSGTIWNDLDSDGVIDGNEVGIENVTLDILKGGQVIATVTTDVNGNYSFNGLAADSYTVKVTDVNAVLNGYTATAEGTGSPATPGDGAVNGEEPADTSGGGDITGLVFGYLSSTPTLVTITSFELIAVPLDEFVARLGISLYEEGVRDYFDPDGDGIVPTLRWETASEIGTIGFYIERWDEDSGWVRINREILPGLITAPLGGEYQLADPSVHMGDGYHYRIIEREAWGSTRTYGPYYLQMQ